MFPGLRNGVLKFCKWLIVPALGLFVIGIAISKPSQAETFRIALVGDPKSGPFSYQYKLLELALDHAGGDHQVEYIAFDGATAKRIMQQMEDGQIDVMFAGYRPEFEQDFSQVYVPLTRGILGHRVFVTRPDMAQALNEVETLDDLKGHCIGSGADWLDTRILETNGFCVEKATYENLWRMLDHGRFDLLNRGAHEVHAEIGLALDAGMDLVVDQNILLIYPLDFFFYVRADDRARHAIITEGLQAAYENGAFMRNFYSDPGIARSLRLIRDSKRKVFRIPNPYMSSQTHAVANSYWEGY